MTRAHTLDAHDALAHFRDEFHVPKHRDGSDSIYLCGNSLGLQPKGVRAAIEQELADWERLGVEGHFHGKNPWYSYHEPLLAPAAQVVGAKPSEVALMNSLTTNLHLLMVSFYRPSGARRKILTRPAVRPATPSPAKLNSTGWTAEAVIEAGSALARTAQGRRHRSAAEREGDRSPSLGGEQFTPVADGGGDHRAGHAAALSASTWRTAGTELALHDWGADFAAWCSYKICTPALRHQRPSRQERHHHDHDLPRLWLG